MEYQAGRTVADIIKETGQKPDSTRKAWKRTVEANKGRNYGQAGGLNAVPSPDEFAAIWGGQKFSLNPPTPKPQPLPDTPKPPAPKSKPAHVTPSAEQIDRVEQWVMFWVPLIATLISVGFTAYGLWHFLEWPGVFLALMFACAMATAVVISRNGNKGDTSFWALLCVVVLELGVTAGLHPHTFADLMPGVGQNGPTFWQLVAAWSCAAFVGFLSSGAVFLIRQYNAEQ